MNKLIENIFLESVTTLSKKSVIYQHLTEAESSNIDSAMITKLYHSAVNKSHIDFDDIPTTKGDITLYSGYQSLLDTVATIRTLSIASKIKLTDVDTVDTAIKNLVSLKELFKKGYALDKEFIEMLYTILVASCVDATTALISTYVTYIRTPDGGDFRIVNNKVSNGAHAINTLEKFNKMTINGETAKVLNSIITSGKQAFIGIDDAAIPIILIGAITLLVVSMREMIFYFYYSRTKMSDYLKTQATFLELNKVNLEAKSAGATKKKDVIKKQEKLVKDLRSLADKISVNTTMANKGAAESIKKDNSGWNFEEVKSEATSTDTTGFILL